MNEDGYAAWLRYRVVDEASCLAAYRRQISTVLVEKNAAAAATAPILVSARQELVAGLSGLLDRRISLATAVQSGSVVVGTARSSALIDRHVPARALAELGEDGFTLRRARVEGGLPVFLIAGNSERGALYGAFAFLRRLQLRQSLDNLSVTERPAFPLRFVNHWENFDGSVERGYAGRSIIDWQQLPGGARGDTRLRDYARLLASLGVQGFATGNESGTRNNSVVFLESANLAKAAALAEVFRAYGIRLFLPAGFNAPRVLGKLATADPNDPGVQKWWHDKVAEVYRHIPDFGGFKVKADSEGQPGPHEYNRTHADGANLLADALRAHGRRDGLVLWRTFVYRLEAGADRARMAYDTFHLLDGAFRSNVVLYAMNGPLDFQVREPVAPLFGLPRTNLMMECQITQEYTGQATALCFLVPQWKEVLDFDTRGEGGKKATVRRVLDGSLHRHRSCGIAGVPNVGRDRNWMGHHLAQANFYGWGRLAWNPDLSARQIAEEWVRLTFDHDRRVVETVTQMLLDSWPIFERYTSPLGLGVLCDRGAHLEPAPEIRYEYHHADKNGVGWDRTQKTGSGYTSQYAPAVAARYESRETCPDALLLFFHHVPYTHRLRSGKTVIQHIYDSHFEGVVQAENLRERWRGLQGRIDNERFAPVLGRFEAQVAHAQRWRDRINGYFHALSGIPDEKGRALPKPSKP